MQAKTASPYSSSEAERNPHLSLPIEILRPIFFFTLHRDWKFFVPWSLNPRQDPRSSILHVCSSWRNAALATPELWNEIVIQLDPQPPQPGIIPIANQILLRSSGTPLDLTVRMCQFQNRAPVDLSADEFIDKIVIPFAKTIRKLRLFVPFPFVKALMTMPCYVVFPLLEVLSLRQASVGTMHPSDLSPPPTLLLPKLRVFELGLTLPKLPPSPIEIPVNFVLWSDVTTFINCIPISMETCMAILSLCPALKSCAFILKPFTQWVWPFRVRLSELERLHIRFCEPDGYSLFLNHCLELPSIRDLALKETNEGLGWTRSLSRFLANSCGSQLEEVFVASPLYDKLYFSYVGIEEFLQKHSSSLKRLYIPLYPSHLNDNIVRQLVSRALCPRLEELSLEAILWRTRQTRMQAIVNGVSDAEKEHRAPIKTLYLFFYSIRRMKSAERELRRMTGEWKDLQCFCRPGYEWIPVDPLELELEWFGFYT
ncbi:hypothetical protein JOM56_008127 [Amanita muscaria]